MKGSPAFFMANYLQSDIAVFSSLYMFNDTFTINSLLTPYILIKTGS